MSAVSTSPQPAPPPAPVVKADLFSSVPGHAVRSAAVTPRIPSAEAPPMKRFLVSVDILRTNFEVQVLVERAAGDVSVGRHGLECVEPARVFGLHTHLE